MLSIDDVLVIILPYMPDRSKVRLLSTCKTFSALISNTVYTDCHSYERVKHLSFLDNIKNIHMSVYEGEPQFIHKNVKSMYIQHTSINFIHNIPDTVESLVFTDHTGKIEKFPANLKRLELGWNYFYNVDNLPAHLEHLTLRSTFDWRIDKLPSTLQYLYLDSGFDQRIDHLPQSLTALHLGSGFDRPIDRLPQNLQALYIKRGRFNQPVDNLPRNLLILHILSDFNQPINNLPPKLIYLYLGPRFTHPIDNLPIPLIKLELHKSYQGSIKNISPNLQTLVYQDEFYHGDEIYKLRDRT